MGFFDNLGTLFGGPDAYQGMGANQGQFDQAQAGVQGGLAQQQQLINALQAQNGIQNQSNVYNQMQGVASGTGPNPAQAMLNNATGQNVANQAALMAGQRGAGANVGLMARQAAQQGGGIQQNAAGQGAAMQAQQQLGALGQMGGMAGQMVGNQMGAIGNYNQMQQGNQGQILGSLQGQNQINQANIQHQMDSTKALWGGIANGVVGAAKTAGGAPPSGVVETAYDGGMVTNSGMYHGGETQHHYKSNKKLDKVPLKDRFPEHIEAMQHLYHGGYADKPIPMKQGGGVPGTEVVPGDSPKNDTVEAKLSPGEVVIPKSVMDSDDPVGEASKFVAALMKKKGGGKSPESDFKEALGRAIKGRKSK